MHPPTDAGDYRDADTDPSFDEAFSGDGPEPRAAYREPLSALRGYGLERARLTLEREASRRGIRFGIGESSGQFNFDPVPRIIAAGEWERVSSGLRQRAVALNRFVEDVYGERRCVTEGVVPAAVIDSCPHHEPRLRPIYEALTDPVTVAGFDLVRDEEGELWVLEDNARTPSGMLFAAAARELAAATLPLDPPPTSPTDHGALLGAALGRLAPRVGDGSGGVVLLTDRAPSGGRWWEHHGLAAELGVAICTLDQLTADAGRVIHRSDEAPGRATEVGVIYRRTTEERLYDRGGEATELGELLVEPLRQGKVAVANAFGTGIADDKLVHAYVEGLVRFYLGTEPILRSVPTYDLTARGDRRSALARIEQLVVKPRDGYGGEGVLIGTHADPGGLDRARRRIEAEPQRWVAQEAIALSTHPTVIDDRLRPRHVDLRPFAITGEQTGVVSGALSRVALEAGEMVVNSSRRGGGKDTWIAPSDSAARP